ncbi:hypothetical protein Jiend_41820 [Micromonospora endophytica]|nr:hypothetical protein Jiend_41820 [Micromonospora endophytica]
MSTPAHGSTGVWCSGSCGGAGGGGVGSADSPQARRRGVAGGTGAEPLQRGAGGSAAVGSGGSTRVPCGPDPAAGAGVSVPATGSAAPGSVAAGVSLSVTCSGLSVPGPWFAGRPAAP